MIYKRQSAGTAVIASLLLCGTVNAGLINDTCDGASPVFDAIPAATGNNMMADSISELQNSCSVSNGDVWYLYTPSFSGTATVDTFGSAQPDTSLSAYEFCGGPEIACNDDAGSLLSEISFPVTAGMDYPIRIASVGPTGGFVLNISNTPGPDNDACLSAAVILDGVPAAEGDNAGASPNDEAEVTCAFAGDSADVWFAYTASCGGTAIVDTAGSLQDDTLISIFTDCGGAGDEIACNDDAIGAQAEVLFPTTAGETYYIRLASVGAPGDYDLNVQCIQAPVNDACAQAVLISEGTPAIEGDNTAAGIDLIESDCVASDHDVWFVYDPSCSGVATIDTVGSGQTDPVLSVFDACGGNEIVCNDDFGGLEAQASFDVVAGTSYWVRLASIGQPGDFDINVSCSGTPGNDLCENATVVMNGQPAFEGDNAAATVNVGVDGGCQASDSDVWFSYTATCTGILTVDSFGSQQADTVLDLYSSCGSGSILCNDDTESLLSEVTLGVTEGESFLIRLASVANAGDYDLNISCLEIPSNDSCILAEPVAGGMAAAAGNNTLASVVDDEEASCAISDFDIWFSYQSACSTEITVSTTGSGQLGTVLSLYESCGGGEQACAVDMDGEGASITFMADADTEYLFRLASSGDPGDYVFNVEFQDTNDNNIPDSCEVQPPQVLPLGSRYLQVGAAPGAVPVALRVLSQDAPCLTKYVDLEVDPLLMQIGVGRLVDAPVYRLPDEWGILLVRDEAIVPAYRYTVQAETAGGGAVATSAEVTTNILGDIDGNGVANIGDVQLAALAFQNEFPGSLAQVDLAPCKPDVIVNLADALWAVIGFQGQPFSFLCELPCD